VERLGRQLEHVARNSAHYRRLWADLGFEPGDRAAATDLTGLPLVRKADYVASLAEHPPWNDFLAVDPDQVARVHFSSGPPSAHGPVCGTQAGMARWADLYAPASWGQGVRGHDVYQVLFGYPWFVGGRGDTASSERIGCAVVLGASGDTERQ